MFWGNRDAKTLEKLLTQMGELYTRVGELNRHLAQLREDVDTLASRHERLRGRVYGAGLHKPPEAETPAAPSRDELKRRLVSTGRFVPGKPPIHSE